MIERYHSCNDPECPLRNPDILADQMIDKDFILKSKSGVPDEVQRTGPCPLKRPVDPDAWAFSTKYLRDNDKKLPLFTPSVVGGYTAGADVGLHDNSYTQLPHEITRASPRKRVTPTRITFDDLQDESFSKIPKPET